MGCSMTALEVLTGVALLVGLWSVICRFNMMQRGVTEPIVGVQHGALGASMFAALFLGPPFAKLVLAVGIAVYLIAGATRWRKRAPVETMTKPVELDYLQDRMP